MFGWYDLSIIETHNAERADLRKSEDTQQNTKKFRSPGSWNTSCLKKGDGKIRALLKGKVTLFHGTIRLGPTKREWENHVEKYL